MKALLLPALLLACIARGCIAEYTFCFNAHTEKDCLNSTRAPDIDLLGHLFGLTEALHWPLSALRHANRTPLTVHLADTTAVATVRSELDTILTRMGKRAWSEEQFQLSQGATIDKWLFAALRTYPYLSDDIETADVIVPLIPMTMVVQVLSFDLPKNTLPLRLKRLFEHSGVDVGTSDPLHHREMLLLLQPLTKSIRTIAEAKKNVLWSCPYHLCNLLPYYNEGRALGRVLDLGPPNKPNIEGLQYVPSPPLETITRMISHCPCILRQKKTVPLFLIASNKRHGHTDGTDTRELLASIDWSKKFPGSVVELVNAAAFDHLKDSAQLSKAERYAALISQAKFCLITASETLNVRRVFEAVVAGCVPVFLSKWKEQLPFAWRNDNAFWSAFSIHIEDYSSVKVVEEALNDILNDEDRYFRLHKEVRLAVPHLTWGFGDPDSSRPVFGRAAANVLQEFVTSLRDKKEI